MLDFIIYWYLSISNIDLEAVQTSIAVAKIETNFGKTGVGRLNNLHGLRNGNIYPCKTSPSNFCIFDSELESFIAFYKIWTTSYGGGLPTEEKAIRYTANQNTDWHLKTNNYINELKTKSTPSPRELSRN